MLKKDDPDKKFFFVKKFMKEVDFHHKIAYRFEKAYRLGKKMGKQRLATLNLEIIDQINEHMPYIDQDPMTLFYLVFFCIYYSNKHLLDFVRKLIARSPPIKQIQKLLEYIDGNGIEKIRTVGQQINSIVYHMVFYQAVNDNLRIVYSQILR